jgi:hypothetical protein
VARVYVFESQGKNSPQINRSGECRAGLELRQSSARRRIHRYDGRAKVVEVKAPVCYICLMKRDEAISRLQQHEADLKRSGVEHLYMFGSTARGEAGDDSDVDLFLIMKEASSVCSS